MTIKIRPEIEQLEDEIITTRRDIHSHPELGFQEIRTAALIAERLTEYGIEVQTEIGKTGVVGTLRGGSDGPMIALRADMDALPVQETSAVVYKSRNDGVMHACGHDGHVATLLAAAKVLAAQREQIKGSVRFLFQPAEEGAGGARYMIEDGCLDGVSEIHGLHYWNYQSFGVIGIQAGPVLAAADRFKIHVKGIGGHGATPQGTVDAVMVGSQLVTALQTIVSRNTDPLESTVVSVGTFNAGSNFNVIAPEANLLGTARSYTEENRQMIKSRMAEIIAGIGQTYGANIILDYEDGYPPTINDEDATHKARQAALKIVGDEGVIKPFLTMGGEDFSYYSRRIPGSFIFIGSLPAGAEPQSIPHHCSHFDIDERALLVGASFYIQLIENELM